MTGELGDRVKIFPKHLARGEKWTELLDFMAWETMS